MNWRRNTFFVVSFPLSKRTDYLKWRNGALFSMRKCFSLSVSLVVCGRNITLFRKKRVKLKQTETDDGRNRREKQQHKKTAGECE